MPPLVLTAAALHSGTSNTAMVCDQPVAPFQSVGLWSPFAKRKAAEIRSKIDTKELKSLDVVPEASDDYKRFKPTERTKTLAGRAVDPRTDPRVHVMAWCCECET